MFFIAIQEVRFYELMAYSACLQRMSSTKSMVITNKKGEDGSMPTPLGERVREMRRKNNLTLESLAEKVGSSKSYMWEIENKDVARPSAEKLDLIAVALGTTTGYLLAGETQNAAETHEDQAFFRKYRDLEEPVKRRLRQMLDILDED